MERSPMELDTGSKKLRAVKEGEIGWLVYDNPDRHNALSTEMQAAAPVALDLFQRDEEIRVVVRAARFAIRQAVRDPAERDVERCGRLVEECFRSEDYVEGRRAFLEKRPPRFQGR